MRSVIKNTFPLLVFFISITAFAQETQPFMDDSYTVENVFGINKATNGGLISGVYYRYSRLLGKGTLMHYGIEAVNIKHTREVRETAVNGSSFVFGKSNYFISIRPTYGREKILFKKAPRRGARITGLIAAGPTLGMEIPYFINLPQNKREQYDPKNPEHNRTFILGNAGPFTGLGSSKFVLGVHLKASLTFETNTTKKKVFGIEAGFSFDAYTRKINILPLSNNQRTFTAAFLAIYFGRRR